MTNLNGRFTSVYLTGVLLLSVGLTACGSSSSSSPKSTSTAQVNTTGSEVTGSSDNVSADPITTSSDNFIVLESNGVKVELPAPNDSMIDYDLIEIKNGSYWPSIDYRVTNNSGSTIRSPRCDVVSFKDGVQVDFDNSVVPHELRPGDTTLDDVLLVGLDDLSEIDTVKFLDCESKEVSDFTENPLLFVDLIEYRTDEDGDVVVVAQLTNNSDSVLFGPLCSLLIRKGNEVLKSVIIQFEDDDDEIGLGFGGPFVSEAAVGREFEEFDSDEFDRNDLFCGFIIAL